jgi:tRNA A37 N6-isopentenylltransferase MiaA
VVGLDVPKDILAQRIEGRAREMFERGVEKEVARAVRGPLSTTAGHVIGLREVAELPRDEAIEAIARRTLQYAAYQRKWMRRMPGLIALPADRSPASIAADIVAALDRFPRSGGQEPVVSGIRRDEADHTGHAV